MNSAASPWTLAVLASLAAACNASATDSAGGGEPTVNYPYVTPDAGMADDAGEPMAVRTTSFLCNMAPPPSYTGCNPDSPTPAAACPDALDAGWLDGTSAAAQTDLACHVVQGPGDAAPQPMCMPSGAGVEGAACASPGDCTATTECVGTGVCRRYCCLGNAACSSDQFCDIEPVAPDGGMNVPVCAPLQPCSLVAQLSDAGTCGPSETCTVVRDGSGKTSCVATGSVLAGGSCDTEPCAAGLACLGTWGTRRCYTLCHTQAPVECSTGQVCATSLSIFTDPAVGVCQ